MKSLCNRSSRALLAAALMGGWAAYAAAQSPAGMPASPLAGGTAAAAGQSFVDVHGNPIVMPASYGAPAGYGAPGMGGPGCYSGGCGYGNPYADFGGCSFPEQSGPHYFDIAVGTVFLMPEEMFLDVPPLASVGVGATAPKLIDPASDFEDYEAGWHIAARLDLGPLSVVEATYMGIYDIGFTDSRNSSEEVTRLINEGVLPFVPPGPGRQFQLNSVFSDYGVNPILGLDAADSYTLDYQSDLQSTELSYRRYWVGYNPRVSGTYLAGFRYIRMTEDLNFDTIALGQLIGTSTSNLFWSSENDLVGAQLGGDAWVTLRQGLRLGGEAKAGIYNNRFKFSRVTNIPDSTITNVNVAEEGNQVAFASEASVDLVADILPSFSIRGGYRVMYMNSLVTVGNNITPADVTSTAVFTQADALYHGFHGTLEYIW